MKGLSVLSAILLAIFSADHGAVAGRSHSLHFVEPASSTRPWRTYTESSKHHNPYARKSKLFKSFLPWEVARKDGRTRIWRANDMTRRRPGQASLTSRLFILNVAAYALQVLNPSFTAWGIKRSELIMNGRELYRLVSPVFLHGGPAHLAMNMYSLKNIGPDVERLFGPGRFLCTYILSGIAGNLFSAFQSPNPALGASGAVFGIMGAYTVFLARHEWLLGRMGEQMSSQLMQTAFLNIALGFANPRIDNWGHIGGFAGGCAMAYYIGPRLYLTSRFENLDNKFLVDRPVFRFPRPIERIPDRIGSLAGGIKKAVRLDRFLPGSSTTRPWQQQQQRRRRDPPTWPLKPDR